MIGDISGARSVKRISRRMLIGVTVAIVFTAPVLKLVHGERNE